ncbi:lutropin-choriogonadotropic hormone receptor isoform X2 [Cynoglossus semilaevis]|uniref:lutropin-choriogonadotropic hormone receptor isoform X2 n=1 Tax=Cynoglossus semilaevis TaxID=244447 RepID=UPI0004962656|nr:lutropin-choriogonadotropic hormone receptor isoform X2 [Cynoglossus semilaevis]
MAPWAVWLLLAVSSVLAVRSCCAYTCPTICRCSEHSFQCSRDTQLLSRARAVSVSRLRLTHLPLKDVPTHAFKELINITFIEISQSDCITQIQRRAFFSLHSLTEISVRNINSLRVIEKGAFTDLPSLQHLSISNTGIIKFPDFSGISSLAPSIFLEMADNMRIDFIPANSFLGITKAEVEMTLVRNGFKEIHSHAFNGTKLNTLILRDNIYLKSIQDDAFEGATGPSAMDVSSTALSSLPPKGLQQLRYLKAISTFALKSLPRPDSLAELLEAELTYPSHCCAFHTWRRKERESALKNFTTFCDLSDKEMKPSAEDMSFIDDINFQYPDLEFDCLNSPFIKCTPKPDAFNPCEDLLGFPVLRCLTWIISLFAVSALHLPLITVSHSKILLILFYPINSLCNPFLYTIFTRAFRKDVCLLLSRCACCHASSDFYRSQTLASNHNSNQKTTTSTRNNHSLSIYAYHIKMKGCFMNKGTT